MVVSSCRVEDLGSPQAGVGVYPSGQARRTFRDSCRRCTDDARRLCHDTRYLGIDRAADLHRGFVYLISWGRVVLVPISAHGTRVSTKLIVSYSSTLSEALE